jgi:hypothetical protein
MDEGKNNKKTLLEIFQNGTVEQFRDALYHMKNLKDGPNKEEGFNLKQKLLLTFDKIKFEEMKKQTNLLTSIKSRLK